MRRIAIYPGTFDPITIGHVDIIRRAATLFDQVIIACAKSSRKSPCIEITDRIRLIEAVFKEDENIEVLELTGLAVTFAKAHGAQFICRGLRTASDFDYEYQLTGMNSKLDPEIETVFLPSSEHVAYISSTIVREIISLGGDVSNFVPSEVVEYLKRK